MDEEEEPVEVPAGELAPGTLRAIAEDFCTRDGTDYGETELTLDQKVAILMRQLKRGEARILFEQRSHTLRIVTDRELRDLD